MGWGAFFGGVAQGVDLSDYVPTAPLEYERVRYCANCACSQKAVGSVPCWNCGSETTTDKPAWWPQSMNGETVRGGDSFSVREIADVLDSVDV